MQKAHALGSVHFRPDGRACAYLGSPPICTRCGSSLEPINDSRPPSSEKERPVLNREVPGSSPGEGSNLTEVPARESLGGAALLKSDAQAVSPVLKHYIVVRRELTGGALLAQVVHAAGESACAVGVNTGRLLPGDTRAVVLVATKAQLEELDRNTLNRSDVQTFVIKETDGPLAGSTTAIGFFSDDPSQAKALVGHLRPWRAE